MKDIGSPNYIPNVQQHTNVAVHRVEKPAQKDSVEVSRTPVIQSHHTTQSRGTQEPVLDSRNQLLYMRTGATVVSTSDDISQTVQYTNQASRITTGTSEESRTLLDIRA